MQCMHKDGIIFRVKSVNKADTNIMNQPLIDSTFNVTTDSGKQSAIGRKCAKVS